MFDPGIGRWLTQDPEGFDAGDPNLYRYVGNAPTNEVDPSGLEPPGSKPKPGTNPPPPELTKPYPADALPLGNPRPVPPPRDGKPAPPIRPMPGERSTIQTAFGEGLGRYGIDWWFWSAPGDKFNCHGCTMYAAGIVKTLDNYPPDLSTPTLPVLIGKFPGFTVDPTMNTSLEAGVTKIIVYTGTGGKPTHTAIQQNDGTWLHKPGAQGGIITTAPGQVSGGRGGYGGVGVVLRRER